MPNAFSYVKISLLLFEKFPYLHGFQIGFEFGSGKVLSQENAICGNYADLVKTRQIVRCQKSWPFLSFRWHSLVLAPHQSSLRSANAECALGQPLSTQNKYSRWDMLNKSFSFSSPLFLVKVTQGTIHSGSFFHFTEWIFTVLSCWWLVNLGLENLQKDSHSFGLSIPSWSFAVASQQIWEMCTGIPGHRGCS